MKINKNNLGFTLIEVLVAASIVIAASTIVVGIITTTFRTSNKTTSQEEVRKNGNYAVSQITKLIQFGDTFEGVSKDGYVFVTDCSVLEPDEPFKYLQIKSEGETKIVACYDGALDNYSNEGLYLEYESLIDINSVIIDEGFCTLTCSMSTSSSSPVIGLDFTLILADEVKSNIPEGNVSIDFSTSVKMRNF